MTIGRSYRYSAVLDENMAESKVPHGVAGTPNETALLSLMERTGYGMIQENGQRKYGGPPPGWEGQAPARGCEVFVGKIPRDCYEDELVPVFEKIGNIYELRLMMDFSGSNRGYCFVMYTSRDDAKRAVRELNNFQIRKGRYLGVCLSVDNCRLFVGGIPKNKTKDEILQEMKKVTEGVVDVIVYPSATDKTKNRGFAFVEFESHRAAAMARRKLIPGRIQLWGHTIAVDWAEPEQEVDEDIMAKVKILYVRNLMLSSTEESLEHTFNQAAGKDNAVERVKKIRDYAFVHYRDRDDCLNAMHALDGSALDGSILEVVLAKPVDKNDYVRYTRGAGGKPAVPQPAMPGLQTYYPSLDATTAAYAGMPYYPTQIGAAAAAAAAMTGRPGLERPGMQSRAHLALRGGVRGRGRGAAGSRGAGGVGRGYPSYMRSYRKYAAEENLYDILPGMELTPTNPITLKPQNAKSTAQQKKVLDELCQKNGWGSPVYQLHSTLGRDGSGDMQLFLFKVSIPALTGQYPTSTFQPNKLCRTVEEAKNFAAEYVLMQLGVPMEGGDAPPSIVPAAAAPMAVGTSALVNTSPPPQTLVFSSASLYQGRPIGPNYSLSNGQVPNPAAAAAAALAAVQRCTSADLSSYSTCSMPLGGASTASYMMAPGKLPTPPLPLQSYQAFAAPAMSYGQY